MNSLSKKEVLKTLREYREQIRAILKTADRETLRIINGELGQMRKAVEGRLKE